ncbi:non-specific lipid transfer protein GPI-anchored 5-like [Prosopis cineraria]|uniref:non-specific lipid transfer protein GPI-anchored 5-like n=1 Tax=Prosopis cineraria TaxID=364024 RepID=UPI00240ED1A5|nr:non-specific lipid transfer protein GPI-anchored 5-like [Prosopis cineraria]
MAFRVMMLTLAVALVATQWTQTAAQSSCTSALTSMSPCLNYITGSSPTPSSTCCSQLSSVVQSSPQCLCSVLNGGGSSLGITINQTLALSLPGACKVQTPPVSQCKGAGNAPTTPSNAPAGSPVGSPEGSIAPSASDIPSAGAGSKTVPTVDGGSSDGSSMKVSFHSMLSLLLIASFVSAVTYF